MLYFVSIFLISLLLSFLSVDWVRKIGHKYDILLYPQEDRWHSKPLAVHGGVGFIPVLVLLLLITTVMFSPISAVFDNQIDQLLMREYYESMIFLIALIGSSSILFIFGWLDDVFNYGAFIRLLVQIIVSTFFILDIGTFQISELYFLNFIYTLIWFVGIINATNLMDCMDGLCSGILSIAIIFLALIILNSTTYDSDQMFFSSNLIFIFLGVLIGFLILNFPPAKIFMGDSGSLPLGFIIASISLPSEFNGLAASNDPFMPLFIPILLLIYPIFDTTLVTITRIMRGDKFYIGGKDHSCHRFVNFGLSEQTSLLLCYMIGFIGGMSSLLLIIFPEVSIPIFLVNLTLTLFLGNFLGKIDIKK